MLNYKANELANKRLCKSFLAQPRSSVSPQTLKIASLGEARLHEVISPYLCIGAYPAMSIQQSVGPITFLMVSDQNTIRGINQAKMQLWMGIMGKSGINLQQGNSEPHCDR